MRHRLINLGPITPGLTTLAILLATCAMAPVAFAQAKPAQAAKPPQAARPPQDAKPPEISVAPAVAGPPRHPGDNVKFDVRFSGKDAARITSASFALRLRGKPHEDQAALHTEILGDLVRPDKNGVFHLAATVPTYVASGDYELYVGANMGVAPDSISIDYNRLAAVHIQNDVTIEKPRIAIR